MIGPLISQKQLNRVLGYLDQGKSDGVEIVTGGHRLDRKGYFVHPTVVTNVDPATSRLFQEEIFGPVVTVLPFDDEDEAVALANDSTYGLAATAWTKDLGRAHRLAKRLKAGTVGLNCQMQFDHSMPFGGYKQSGWGYESGKAGHRNLPANQDRLGADVGVGGGGCEPQRAGASLRYLRCLMRTLVLRCFRPKSRPPRQVAGCCWQACC